MIYTARKVSDISPLSARAKRAVSVAAVLLFTLSPTVAYAATAAATDYVLNTFSFLIWGALVMWMCAGFTMLEAGSVRTKNASMICLKNIGLYSIAGLAFYFVGYNLMYVDVDQFAGTLKLFRGSSPEEIALLSGTQVDEEQIAEYGHSRMSDWFFQMVFVATTASIISGTLAERVKLWAFFAFTLILTALIYPIVGAWTWGGGWLADLGFQDFAGSTVVHSTGGWAALAGIFVVGARLNKFRSDGTVKPTPPSNVVAVTLGIFILWLGWFGFNGGSQLAIAGMADALSMSIILVNTNLAGAAGVIVAIAVSRPLFGRIDLLAGLNGAIAGLVSVTAGPLFVDHYWAVLIGGVGGLLCTMSMRGMELLKLDDVVGAVPAHLVAGIWGTIAVCIAAGGNVGVQLIGIVAIGAFVFVASFVTWKILELLIGVRVTDRVEALGQDVAELGIEAYPEFVLMPDQDDVHAAKGTS